MVPGRTNTGLQNYNFYNSILNFKSETLNSLPINRTFKKKFFALLLKNFGYHYFLFVSLALFNDTSFSNFANIFLTEISDLIYIYLSLNF